MKKERLKDYETVIETNKQIIKLYSILADLEKNNELNSESYNRTISLIKRLRDKNEELILKHSLYGEGLSTYIDRLRIDDDNETLVDKEINIDETAVDRFVHFINDYSLVTKEYDRNLLYKDFEVIFIGEEHYNREQAIKIWNEEYNMSLELAEFRADEIINQTLSKSEIGFDVDDEMFDIDCAKAAMYRQENYIINTLLFYLTKNIEAVENKEVKDMLINFKYQMISVSKFAEDAFLNNPLDYIDIDTYKNEMNRMIKEESITHRFLDNWDQHYTKLFDESLCNLQMVDANKKYNIVDEVYDIILATLMQTYESAMIEKKNVYHVHGLRNKMNKSLTKKYTKNTINLSKNLEKSTMLSKNN